MSEITHINDLTGDERQFIETMRKRKSTGIFKLTVELVDGAWELSLLCRLAGTTFVQYAE
jgi:hypothetical protein